MQVIRDGVAVEVSKKDMTPDEVRAYNATAKREQRARKKEEEQAQADLIDPSTKEFLERFNALSPEDQETWMALHKREREKFYFIKCLRVHREMCPKLGIPDVQPGETLYSFTKRVIDAANADPEEAPIVWNIQIPDRPIRVDAN